MLIEADDPGLDPNIISWWSCPPSYCCSSYGGEVADLTEIWSSQPLTIFSNPQQSQWPNNIEWHGAVGQYSCNVLQDLFWEPSYLLAWNNQIYIRQISLTLFVAKYRPETKRFSNKWGHVSISSLTLSSSIARSGYLCQIATHTLNTPTLE